jgi:small subunit ribosomal protein S7
MKRGKRGLSERTVYAALELAAKRLNVDVLDVFHKAMNNVKPVLEVKSRRVGGSTYQIPVEVRPERRTSLAMRWLIIYARQRGERTMKEKLAGELMDAYKGEGATVKKKEDTHRMAEANKAFAHYRW